MFYPLLFLFEVLMAFNTIENTVTFSGADITVIAYSDIVTPLSSKYLQNIRGITELKELERENVDLKGELKKEADFNEKTKLKIKVKENESIQKTLKDLFITTSKIRHRNLGSIHTITYSSFREKFAVRGLGKVQPKGYTRGPRTIAGTMVFNMFQEHEFLDFLASEDENILYTHPRSMMLDQIKPFNILILFANEYGAYSSLHLFDIDLSSEGQEMSIENIVTHNTMNFYAVEMVPMTSLGSNFKSYNDMMYGAVRTGIAKKEESKSYNGKEIYKSDNLLNRGYDDVSKNELLSRSRGFF